MAPTAAVAAPNFWDTIDPFHATGLVMDDRRPLVNGDGVTNPGPPEGKASFLGSEPWLPSNPMFWGAVALAVTAGAMALSSGKVGARVSERAHVGPIEEELSAGSKKEKDEK